MPPNSSINDESFDYIIVGGGTAGLVLANRLTTDPDISVLVVEAGADRLKDPKITIPGLATTLYNDPTYDWEFETIPQVCNFVSSKRTMSYRRKRLGTYADVRS